MEFEEWWSSYKKENYSGLNYAFPTYGEKEAAKAAFQERSNLTSQCSGQEYRCTRCGIKFNPDLCGECCHRD